MNKFSWLNLSYWWILIFKFFDCVTTFYALAYLEGTVEKNPIVKFCIDNLGLFPTIVNVYLVNLLFITFLRDYCAKRNKGNIMMYLLAAMLTLVVANNVVVILLRSQV